MSPDLKEGREQAALSIPREASIPDRGKSMYKGPEASIGPAASSSEEEAIMAGGGGGMWGVGDQARGSGQV